MNQILKDAIYSNGNQRHVDFIADLGGMTVPEKKIFQMLHDGESDVYIQIKLGLSRKAYDKLADQVRRKTLTAVMSCIECKMNSSK